MKRVIRTIGIVLMLVIFPAMSWYYLSQGYDYRKDVYDRTKPKSPWDASKFAQFSEDINLKGKTTVLLNEEVSDDFVSRFYDQYKDAYTFQLVTHRPNAIGNNVVIFDIQQGNYPSAVLIDTAAQIRNIYINDTQSLTMLIEDTAIVLPRAPEKDIITK